MSATQRTAYLLVNGTVRHNSNIFTQLNIKLCVFNFTNAQKSSCQKIIRFYPCVWDFLSLRDVRETVASIFKGSPLRVLQLFGFLVAWMYKSGAHSLGVVEHRWPSYTGCGGAQVILHYWAILLTINSLPGLKVFINDWFRPM